MSDLYRKERIQELNVRVKRRELVSRLNHQLPEMEMNFLSIEETADFSKKVYEKIDTISDQVKLPKDYQTSVNSILNNKERIDRLQNKDIVILHRNDSETGALVLDVQYFWGNIDSVIALSGFKDGYRDLIVVEKNMNFGLCIERHEYYNKLVVWLS